MTDANFSHLESLINQAWEDRTQINSSNASKELRQAVADVISGLNNGHLRVATKVSTGQWNVNQWVKKAVLLSFKLQDNENRILDPSHWKEI